MVSKSPLTAIPVPNGLVWLIYGGYTLTTYKSWDDPPSGFSSLLIHRKHLRRYLFERVCGLRTPKPMEE